MFSLEQFGRLGTNVVLERDVLVWHPETMEIGNNVYIGHRSMIKGHPKGRLKIGDNVWIGQNVFMHSAGGITIENDVGIGPGVMMLTSYHQITPRTQILLDSPLEFEPIHIGQGADLGVGSVLLPGIAIGQGAQVGAGSVVTRDVPAFCVVAGNPAKILRERPAS